MEGLVVGRKSSLMDATPIRVKNVVNEAENETKKGRTKKTRQKRQNRKTIYTKKKKENT